MSLTEVDIVLEVVAIIGTLIFGILAVQQKDLVRAVVAYGISSAFLAMLFFLLASPFVAVLELTVGAGLILVLFLVALTLSAGSEKEIGMEGCS